GLVGETEEAERQEFVIALLDGERPGIGIHGATDLETGRDQRAGIHLRRAAEDDAVLVENENGARRLDRSENLARRRREQRIAQARARVELADDAVEHDPALLVGPVLRLVEDEAGLLPDIECLPGEDGARLGLVDRYLHALAVARLGRRLGTFPGVQSGRI